MSWKLPVLVCAVGLGGLALIGVIALHLLGAAGISFSLKVVPEPIGVVLSLLIGLAGLVTCLVFRKPRSTPKP